MDPREGKRIVKRHHRVGSLALALALCGSLVSCDEMFGPSDGPESESLSVDVYGTRMFSPAWETGQTDMLATSDQQIDWAIAETEEALLMLGDPDGWDMLVAEGNWAEYRDGRMPELHGTMCELGDAGRRGGQIVVSIIHANYELTYEAAERLRVHWMKRGWVVTDIFRGPLPDGMPLVYFRADRYGGSRISLYARDNAVDLRVTSACSPSSGLG